jgi:hypothetical protein
MITDFIVITSKIFTITTTITIAIRSVYYHHHHHHHHHNHHHHHLSYYMMTGRR